MCIRDRPYNALKNDLKTALNRNNVGQAVLTGLQNMKDAVKKGVIDTGVFGEFGLEYLCLLYTSRCV